MSTKTNVQVLDVGQGSGNLIEIYNGGTLTHLVLVDLGSDLDESTAGKAAAQYVVDTIKAITPHTLDALILSHSDSDHISLLGVLLANFDPPTKIPATKPVLTINNIYYGGDPRLYKKGKKKKSPNRLKDAQKYLKPPTTIATAYCANVTGWDDTAHKWDPFHISDDVAFYMIIGNALADDVELVSESSKKRRKLQVSYTINTKSLVVGVRSQNVDWVLTGDATGLTLAKCNEIFAKAGALTDCFMVTAPHHSSATTTFDLGGIISTTLDATQLAEQNLKDFVINVSAQTISASAAQATHKHPSQRVISYFWPKLSAQIWFTDPDLGTNNHFYNAFLLNKAFQLQLADKSFENWPTKLRGGGGWITVQTAANVFTTIYYIANQERGVLLPPTPATEVAKLATGKVAPKGVQWSFTIGAGTKKITRRTNRDVLARSAALGFPPVILPTRYSSSLTERSIFDSTSTATALDFVQIPIVSRIAPSSPPRTAAPLLSRLHVIR